MYLLDQHTLPFMAANICGATITFLNLGFCRVRGLRWLIFSSLMWHEENKKHHYFLCLEDAMNKSRQILLFFRNIKKRKLVFFHLKPHDA